MTNAHTDQRSQQQARLDAEKRNQVLNGNRNAMNMPFNRMNLPNGMRMPQDAMQRQAMLRNMYVHVRAGCCSSFNAESEPC